MDVIGYQVVNDQDKPWSGKPTPMPYTEARDQLAAARKVCAKYWRMIPVSAAPQRSGAR